MFKVNNKDSKTTPGKLLKRRNIRQGNSEYLDLEVMVLSGILINSINSREYFKSKFFLFHALQCTLEELGFRGKTYLFNKIFNFSFLAHLSKLY